MSAGEQAVEMRLRAAALLLLFVGLGDGASAQTAAPQSSAEKPAAAGTFRGVKVLEADPDPIPAPLPVPITPPPIIKPQNSGAATSLDAPAPIRHPQAPVIVVHFCSRPFSAPDLTLDASTDFERSLSRALRSKKRVVVDLSQTYPDKSPPPGALSPWLSEVKSAGGTVTVKQYCDAARGSLSSWFAEVFGGHPGSIYRPARQYDAILHADALDHVITQVEFTPKSGDTLR